MKIVLWIGNGANQKAFANKLNSLYPISTIFIESRKKKKTLQLSKVITKILDLTIFHSIHRAWNNLMSYYNETFPRLPEVKCFCVSNINDESVYNETSKINPDLILVSGTSLIKEDLLKIHSTYGIMNLHTGLSPYIKGGPNCTNWCISTLQIHLIGNTIMWIDKGIDSGNIITSELTQFDGNETLNEIHLKVMEHAHELYINAVNKVIKGNIQGIPQNNLVTGKTYYTKHWGIQQKFNLLFNIKKFKSIVLSDSYKFEQSKVTTVNLN